MKIHFHATENRHAPRRISGESVAAEVVFLVACLAAAALVVSAVTGRLDEVGRRFFAAVGM